MKIKVSYSKNIHIKKDLEKHSQLFPASTAPRTLFCRPTSDDFDMFQTRRLSQIITTCSRQSSSPTQQHSVFASIYYRSDSHSSIFIASNFEHWLIKTRGNSSSMMLCNKNRSLIRRRPQKCVSPRIYRSIYPIRTTLFDSQIEEFSRRHISKCSAYVSLIIFLLLLDHDHANDVGISCDGKKCAAATAARNY